MSAICIQEIMIMIKLTQYWKVRNQINTIKKLEIKLKYDIKDRDQIHSLSKKKKKNYYLCLLFAI